MLRLTLIFVDMGEKTILRPTSKYCVPDTQNILGDKIENHNKRIQCKGENNDDTL